MKTYRRCITLFLIAVLLGFTGGLWADALSQPPSFWKEKLVALPDPDISGAEPAVQQILKSAREGTANVLMRSHSDVKELARELGNLGNLYQLYDIHTLAEICYGNARRLEPSNFRWAYYAAYLSLVDGRIEQAVERLQMAERLNQDYQPLALRLGQAWYDLHQFNKAGELLSRASEVSGLRATALYYLGQIDLLERRYQQAIDRFEQVLLIDPAASQVHYPLARAYRGAGDGARAREHLARRGDQLPAVEDPLVQQLNALRKGARPLYFQAMRAIEQRDYEQAVEAFRAGLERDPGNINAQISLSRSLYLTGEREQAKQLLASVLEREPDNVLAMFLSGVLQDRAGEAAVIDVYNRVLALDPGHSGAHYFRANRLLREKRYAEAASQYGEALVNQPDNPSARLYRTVALHHAGEADSVLDGLLAAEIKQYPEQHLAIYARARLLALSRDEAVHDPEKALQLARGLVDSYAIPPHLETMAMALAANGDFQQAVELQKQLLAGALWMGPASLQQRLKKTLHDYQQQETPSEPWHEDDQMLLPPPVDGVAVFRDYPSPVPF